MFLYVYGGVGEGVSQEGASVGWLDERSWQI